ncbi:ribonuclease HII [Verrucomicrobiaceae bacterium R5-34]|uniref:Ribonuclease HII n=1 Tax=Oceaniferula flava TaxID=2800421 RepID=A0AAE2SD86_9BACT|nr:ribonuclease HII [Verrucomicrobiaceae bacterium R5-34]MBK1855743.1 ribonuclease HII [Oceaniferula flavus]MBM1137050.1 ribonuclease HII [Oceaniferula flavus]
MPDLEFENARRQQGHTLIAGIDEAGRGPLAGPVAAAAVILPDNFTHPLLNDSKKLTEKRREALYAELTERDDILWGLSFADAEEIDRINILRATHAAMARATEALTPTPDFCLIDGLAVPSFPFPSEGIVKGDGKSLSIAAASVIAKVSRDRLMLQYAEQYPAYGFERHKGYGTKVHLEALQEHGPCPIHRQSFAPVAKATRPQ